MAHKKQAGPKETRRYHSASFDYARDYRAIDFRKHPELYEIGRGEQGVLLVEPYKSELLPHWRFRTPAIAEASSTKLYELFLLYKQQSDFVGMDMARKFLQMGYTRARRYANHASGKKYEQNPQKEGTAAGEKEARKAVRPQEDNALTNEKAESARIFYAKYLEAREDPAYLRMKEAHKQRKV